MFVTTSSRLFCSCGREDIIDLLRPGNGPLTLREDIRKGVYVEGLCETVVENGEQPQHHRNTCICGITAIQMFQPPQADHIPCRVSAMQVS